MLDIEVGTYIRLVEPLPSVGSVALPRSRQGFQFLPQFFM